MSGIETVDGNRTKDCIESIERSEPSSVDADELSPERHVLGKVLVPLMKGVIYKESDPARWDSLLTLQPRILDHVSVLGLTLIVDEAEGYAFLRGRPDLDDDLPRLTSRRPLSFPVSLLLALLRRRLVEFDATGGETRLVLTRDEIVDMLRLFMRDTSNEAKLIDQVDTQIRKVIDLGFLRKLKQSNTDSQVRYEVKRIIRAFVDAQWLSDFDQQLSTYAAHLAGDDSPPTHSTNRPSPDTSLPKIPASTLDSPRVALIDDHAADDSRP